MSSLTSKVMLVDLSISMFAPTKTDKKATQEVIDSNGASSDAGRFVKAVIPKEALEAIKTIVSEARAYHNKKSLPWNDNGARILPSAHYMEYTDKLRQLKAKFNREVDNFVFKYLDLVDKRKNELKALFNPNDYPSVEIVRERFKFKTSFDAIPAGEDFRVTLAEDDLAEVRKEIDDRVKTAVDNARLDLWARLREPVCKMAAALKDPKQKFHDTLVGNIRDILNLVPALNITSDPQLDAIRNEIDDRLLQHTPATLRQSKRIRKDTADAANAILEKMAGFMPMLTGEQATAVEPVQVEAEPEQPEQAAPEPEQHSESECAEPSNIIAFTLPDNSCPQPGQTVSAAPIIAQTATGFLF